MEKRDEWSKEGFERYCGAKVSNEVVGSFYIRDNASHMFYGFIYGVQITTCTLTGAQSVPRLVKTMSRTQALRTPIRSACMFLRAGSVTCLLILEINLQLVNAIQQHNSNMLFSSELHVETGINCGIRIKTTLTFRYQRAHRLSGKWTNGRTDHPVRRRLNSFARFLSFIQMETHNSGLTNKYRKLY